MGGAGLGPAEGTVRFTGHGLLAAVAVTVSVLLLAGPVGAGSVGGRTGPSPGSFGAHNPIVTGVSWQPYTSPPGLAVPYGGSLASDLADDGVVAFGGCATVACTNTTNTTWFESDGSWTELHPSAAPSARSNASMAWDPVDGYVLLFGGYGCLNARCTSSGFLNDTWAFKAGTWNPVVPSGPTPPPSAWAGLAYDPADREMVLFGGSACATSCATWTYAAGAWTELNLTVEPPARITEGFATDYADQGALLFGGAQSPSKLLQDTWLFSGNQWTDLTPRNLSHYPTPRSATAMTWDGALGEVVMAGGSGPPSSPNPQGSLNETWAFSNGTWLQWGGIGERWGFNITPQDTGGAGLAEDPSSGILVLLGGCLLACPALQPWGFGPGHEVAVEGNLANCARVSFNGANLSEGSAPYGLQNGTYPLTISTCHGFEIANVSASSALTLNATSQNLSGWTGSVVVRGPGNLTVNLSRAPSSSGPTGLAAISFLGLDFLELLLIGVAVAVAAVFLIVSELGTRRRRRRPPPPTAKPPSTGGF